MWIRVNDVAFGDMPAEQEAWLEKQAGEGDQFVSIEQGDWSSVREIDTEAHSLSYVMQNHPGEYIICDRDSDEATTLRNAGCAETKGYYSDQAVFRCE